MGLFDNIRSGALSASDNIKSRALIASKKESIEPTESSREVPIDESAPAFNANVKGLLDNIKSGVSSASDNIKSGALSASDNIKSRALIASEKESVEPTESSREVPLDESASAFNVNVKGLLDNIKSGAFSTIKKESREPTETAESSREESIDESALVKNADATQQKPEGASKQSLQPLQLGTDNFVFVNDDSYTYPSLFEEADDMVKLSNLIYALIELRELARSGKLDEHPKSLKILELPLPMDQALSIIATEAEVLKEFLSDGTHDASLSALQSLTDPQIASKSADRGAVVDLNAGGDKNISEQNRMYGSLLDMWNTHHLTASDKEDGIEVEAVSEYNVSTITAVGDEKSNSELVYVVGINPALKRITVAFRGSATTADFVTDAKIDMVQVPDPRVFATTMENSSSGKTYHEENEIIDNKICIHQGFYEYLFGTDSKKQESKYAEIMAHVQRLYESNSTYRNEYKLYVTGHSLGGALSTLFGFYASASSSLPQPVTVISVASPRVGNLAFAQTFALFESQGKIRHLRVANHKDPVTLGPTVSSKRVLTLAAMAFSPLGYLALKLSGNDVGVEETYYHTGIKLKLLGGEAQEGAERCALSYSGARFFSKEKESEDLKVDDDDKDEEVAGKKNPTSMMGAPDMPVVSYHYGNVYSERMALVKNDLVGLTLNQLYVEKTGKS